MPSSAASKGVTLGEPFARRDQQREADYLGMYLFLASEIMLFGALVALLFADRLRHPGAAEAAAVRLDLWLGVANTVILLTSSLLVALGIVAARAGRARAAAGWTLGAAGLGLLFLAVKAVEYAKDFADGVTPLLGRGRPEALFINLYFTATALHAVHLLIGMALLAALGLRLWRGAVKVPGQSVVVEMTGLYWHFVDVVWVFLFPLLYLPRP